MTGRSLICAAVFVGGADHLAMAEAAAGEAHRHHVRPMVAAVGAALRAHLRRAAEFAHGEDQHVVKQAALFEVAHQRRDEMVEQRQAAGPGLVLMPP